MKEWEEVIGVSWRTSEREGSCWGEVVLKQKHLWVNVFIASE